MHPSRTAKIEEIAAHFCAAPLTAETVFLRPAYQSSRRPALSCGTSRRWLTSITGAHEVLRRDGARFAVGERLEENRGHADRVVVELQRVRHGHPPRPAPARGAAARQRRARALLSELRAVSGSCPAASW